MCNHPCSLQHLFMSFNILDQTIVYYVQMCACSMYVWILVLISLVLGSLLYTKVFYQRFYDLGQVYNVSIIIARTSIFAKVFSSLQVVLSCWLYTNKHPTTWKLSGGFDFNYLNFCTYSLFIMMLILDVKFIICSFIQKLTILKCKPSVNSRGTDRQTD